VAEAAAYASFHPNTIYLALTDGSLHGTRRGERGRYRVYQECVDAWLADVLCVHKQNVTQLRRIA
jgi:excisionase family DNA binding protein